MHDIPEILYERILCGFFKNNFEVDFNLKPHLLEGYLFKSIAAKQLAIKF